MKTILVLVSLCVECCVLCVVYLNEDDTRSV